MDDQEFIIQLEFEANYFTDELSDEALDRGRFTASKLWYVQ